MHANAVPQAVSCELYSDNTCLVFTDKDIKIAKEQLNKDLNSLYAWFIDNELSIHFGEEETK